MNANIAESTSSTGEGVTGTQAVGTQQVVSTNGDLDTGVRDTDAASVEQLSERKHPSQLSPVADYQTDRYRLVTPFTQL